MKITELINEVGIENALKHLQDDLFIKVKEYDNFYKLNYDQIFSPKANPLVVECRALLLDKEGNVVPVHSHDSLIMVNNQKLPIILYGKILSTIPKKMVH